MILISREVGSRELLPLFQRYGIPTELVALPYGDVAFDGNGPDGLMSVCVERKTLHDMLSCIDSGRYSAYQRVGMANIYNKSCLMLEGNWRPHDGDGADVLMEGFRNKEGKIVYAPCQYRSRPVLYSKLRRYLFSVEFTGVTVMYTRDIRHTVHDICELYHYLQKPWDRHRSMLEMQKIVLPSITGRPSLRRRWAADLDGVGEGLSLEAEQLFRTAGELSRADESAWMKIKGIGPRMARRIIHQIWT
jgi:ERCC4-type nuclease